MAPPNRQTPRPALDDAARAARDPPPRPRRGPARHHRGRPYRWLEGRRREVAGLGRRPEPPQSCVLDALPSGGDPARLLPLLQAPISAAPPPVKGERVFTLERGGDREQAVLCVRPATGDAPEPPRVLADPAALAGDPTDRSSTGTTLPDGALVAFGLSTGGDGQEAPGPSLDVGTGDLLADRIPTPAPPPRSPGYPTGRPSPMPAT